MSSPFIGITTQRAATGGSPVVGSPETYIQGRTKCRGMPLLIPLNLTTAELDEVFTSPGWGTLPGGGDIDPVFFQGPAHHAVYGIDPDRDRVELHLVRQAAEIGKPFWAFAAVSR